MPKWVKGGMRILKPNPWIIAIGTFGELYRWYDQRFELDTLPEGWSIDCGPNGPLDIGYGTVIQQYSSCPGGGCTPGFTNPGGEIMGSTGIQLSTQFGANSPCAFPPACGGGRRQRGFSYSIGPANSAWGTPLGRYQQALKICWDGVDCANPICEETWWDPVKKPLYRPMPAPRWAPNRPLPGVPRPSPLPIPYEYIPYHPSNRVRQSPRIRNRPNHWPPTEDPSVDIPVGSPFPAPVPGLHPKRPPAPDEKEKKRKLDWRQTHAWLGVLEGLASKYAEVDDKTAAIYKALDWRVRRWKGRDGVWRDRDITTASRMRRIAQYVDRLSVTEMIKNMVMEETIDAIGGAIGRANKRAIDNNPYYTGLTGMQYGQRFTKASWDEVLQSMRAEAAAKEKPRDWYRYIPIGPDGRRIDLASLPPDATTYQASWGEVRNAPYWYLPPGTTWERRLVKGTRQRIPWLQQTYNKTIVPRRGTSRWWSRDTDRIAFRERSWYRDYN